MKKAIIVWAVGQDGTILQSFLISKGYNIIWISKDTNSYHGMIWTERFTDILDIGQVETLIKVHKPDEIYYLAAYHHSSQDIMPNDDIMFKESTDAHVNWYLNILKAVSKYSPTTKICYASSCLIYGWSETKQQDEMTLPVPNSIYAITKLEGMYLGNLFAEKYNLQIINAILYNHESEFRSSKFVSMKIIQWAIKISQWLQDKMILWDLSTQVDRWYAWDYVEAMYLLLQANKKWDYMISSGLLHTIQDLVEIVFWYLKLDWEKYIVVDKNIIQRWSACLFWNNDKIFRDIWRQPHTWFEEMIISMIKKSL